MMRRCLLELRVLGESVATIVMTWLLLGWSARKTVTQDMVMAPYYDSSLRAGTDWSDHLYRIGVLGGSMMHDVAGTPPIVQLCSALSLSTTGTLNVVAMFLQTCFAFFGVAIVEALLILWGRGERLSPQRRIIAIWLCGFMPIVGWRLALAHENLIFGLLPLLAAVALVLAARARTLGPVTLLFAAFTVANGVSGFGPQTVVYGAVFGAPLLVSAIIDAPRGRRWKRPQWIAAAALAAGVLVVMPRMVGMIAHALGDDAIRGFHESVTYSFGSHTGGDWLASIGWTKAFASGPEDLLHEHNFPLGPLVLFAIVLWPAAVSRRMLWTLGVTLAIAMMFASGLEPFATLLQKLVPPLAAFRVPGRAVLPLLMFVPMFGLAALWSRPPPAPEDAKTSWLAIGVGAVAIVAAIRVPGHVREPIAWLLCGALVLVARTGGPAIVQRLRATRFAVFALPIIAALGVAAFDERFPRDRVFDPIERGPQAIRAAVLDGAPDAADPLVRLQIVDAPPPYAMTTAAAARLGSLDGMWYPPHRFLELVGALRGKRLPSTAVAFVLTADRGFPVLQQLYNVRYLVRLGGDGHIERLPEPAGPAWFPARIDTIDDSAAMVQAIAAHGATPADLHAELATTAWVLRADGPMPPPDPACARARVVGAHSDERGQTATIAVDAPAACPLVVAANYVNTLRATAIVDGAPQDARVFPIDVALTGIAVPARATEVILEPVATVPAWANAAAILGWLVLAAAIALGIRDRSAGVEPRAEPHEPDVAPIRPRKWIDRLRTDRGLALLACALLAAAILYLPTLGRSIVNYDDPWLVRDNYQLRDPSWSTLHTVFFDLDTSSPQRYALGAEYLPVRDLSIMTDYAVWGDNYAGFHLTSLLVYLAAIALAFGMLVEFGIDRTIAGVAVLIWALHPAHAESVAWLAERKGVLAAAFSCAAGYGYARFRAGGSARWIAVAALAAVAAVWSKAPAAFAIAAIAMLEVVLPARRVSWRRSLVGLAAFGVAALAFVPVIATALNATIVGTDSNAPAGRAATVLGVHGLYVELALMALRNAISYNVDSASPSVVQIVLGSVALIAVVAALVRKRVSPEYRAAAALWLFGWLPVSHLLLPVHTVIAADRYILFATLGFALAIAVALQRIASRRVRIAAGTAFLVIALIRAFDAQSQWASSLAVWDRAVESNPENGTNWVGLAEELQETGRPDLAWDAVETGLEHSDLPRLHLRKALLLLQRGERAAALPVMLHAAEGGEPRAMANYALLELEDKHPDSALAWARKASQAGPGMAHARRTHGKIALETHHADEALAELRVAYEIEPQCTNRYNLALALAELHHTDEALLQLDACALDPAMGPAARDLAAHLRRDMR